jgi:hypothetical protein
MADDAVPTTVRVPLGVVIARDAVDHPWQDHVWRVDSVFLDAPPVTAWRKLREDGRSTTWHAATLDLELHRSDTPGYIVNLETGAPVVYVILREGPGDGSAPDPAVEPHHVHLMTASGHDVEAYGHLGQEIIGEPAMPAPLIELVKAFVSAHHVKAPFIKRQRKPHVREEPHQFGQEPLAVLRARRKRSGETP